MNPLKFIAILVLSLQLATTMIADEPPEAEEQRWIQIFNGKDLEDWQPKFAKHELGENFADTFRVDDGVLKVSYDKYDRFRGEFGHLFYKMPFSHYRIRIEYRFVGDQVQRGPPWAFRNNGLMLHCQPPESMFKDQNFPISLEVQLLGGNGTDKRSTGNLCTPSTNVVMNGELHLDHCTPSTSETFHGDQWVTVEVEVEHDEQITHFVNGKQVMQYSQPQLDPRDEYARPRIVDDETAISSGYIAIQAESHPTEFRRIELLNLEK